MGQVFFDGKFIDSKEALVPVGTHALQYGTGCFEGIRAYYNEKDQCLYVFRLEDHLQRLINSGKILFIHLPYSVKEMVDFTIQLLQKNFEETDIYIRPFAFKHDVSFSLDLSTLQDGLVIYTQAMGRYFSNNKGLKVMTSSWRRLPDNTIPPRGKISGSYVNATLAKTESALNGYDEALVMDEQGHIVEGSGENIFIIRNGKVITPPESDDILVGITRDTVMTILKQELKIEVIERSIDRSELYSCDEIFLTGTAAEVSPVVEVDKRKIGNGKIGQISQKVADIFQKIVRGEYQKYSHYLTKVSL